MKKRPGRDGAWLAIAVLLGSILAWANPQALGAVDVLERSYNPLRTGANTGEATLTPANVTSSANQFHKQFVMSVDGKIEGSPLYASNINIAGGVHNVVYVATMHNTVFAFDADSGRQLSMRSLGNPVTGQDLHELKPVTIHAEWGIASTPVIDRATGTLYVVRWGYEDGVSGPTYGLFSLDMSNLSNDKFAPVLIDGYDVGGSGFQRHRQMQRAGLALAVKPNGAKALVVAFGGGEGQYSPPGWVIAFDTSKLASTNALANVWCSNPNNTAGKGGGGGVWMANAAPAVDDNGDIYVVTGNGPYNPQFGFDQLGESVVRLTWNPGTPGSLVVSDWFTPSLGGMSGGILSLSANGTADAILWANEAFGNLPSDPAAQRAPTPNILRAYDVSTASTGTLQSIWDSEIEPNDHVGAPTKFAPPLVANGKVYQATYDNQIVVYGLGAASPTPVRDVRRTVVFIYAQTHHDQEMFVRGGGKGGNPIRIRHRNWLNDHTDQYRWGDVYLDWSNGKIGQARRLPDLGGGSPVDWTTSVAQGQNQPYIWMAGYGIADENNFGPDYWMLDVDMDCEQAFDDGKSHRWFELKAFVVTPLMTAVAPTPGWEGDIAQVSNPAPPYASANHMGMCGMVNVFVANFPDLPAGRDPNSAQFFSPSYTYLSPIDERGASEEVLNNTPCVSPGIEKRCVGNIAQTCQSVDAGKFFRSVVCPVKAGMFSREQSCRGRSQSPVVWIAEERET